MYANDEMRAMSDRADRVHREAASARRAVLWAGIAVLLVAELTEYMRNARRRTAHRIGDRWAEVERRQHRAAENAELGVLARRLTRSRT
jgi:hypothetical protein